MMRSIDEILVKAANRYATLWRDALLTDTTEPIEFALGPPSASTINGQSTKVAAWLTAWRMYARDTPSVTLRTKVVHAAFGNQPVYTHLDVAGTPALAELNEDTHTHWQRAQIRWTRLRPAATDNRAIRPWLAQIVDLSDGDFDLLLTAAQWFRTHPHSGLTIRRVPILGMHTKWLARHRRLVLAILGYASVGEGPGELERQDGSDEDDDFDPADLPNADLDALGLRPVPREADISLSDTQMRHLLGGLHHLRAPIDELARLPLTPRTVLVVENKEAALSLGDMDGLVVVHSLGNHMEVLRQLPWLPRHNTIYWGDLDRHGLTLLSRARSALPGIRSILMTVRDVAEFEHLSVTENLGRYDPPDSTLRPDEQAALDALETEHGYMRIEQERLPVETVEAALRDELSLSIPGGP